MRALVGREAGDSDAGTARPPQFLEPDDDHVADGRRDEAGRSTGSIAAPRPAAALSTISTPATIGPPNTAATAAKALEVERTHSQALVEPRERREDNGNNRTERDDTDRARRRTRAWRWPRERFRARDRASGLAAEPSSGECPPSPGGTSGRPRRSQLRPRAGAGQGTTAATSIRARPGGRPRSSAGGRGRGRGTRRPRARPGRR